MKQTKTKTLCLLLAALMLLSSLTACGKDKEKDSNLIQLGDYELLYKGACIMEDSDGNDAIVLSLDFTNNSKENVFALLEGTWISEDGLQKYVFSTDADGSELRAAELWRSGTEKMWNGWELRVESAFQTPYSGGEYGEDVAEHLQEIVLRNSDHAAADLHLLYDTQNAVILSGGMTYRREQG